MFTEMRSMALLQKAVHGPQVIPATQALRIATIDGARALGLENEIGTLEAGKLADVTVVDFRTLHASPDSGDPISALVYSSQTSDVRSVVIAGQLVMRDRELLTLDEKSILEDGNRERVALLKRAGIER
jgi:cytosine/adenosine deaminase-related metal-dependent hydrolase